MLYGQLKSGTDYGGSVKSPALELFTKAPVRNNSCILPSLLEQQVSFPVTPSMGDLANKDRHLQTNPTGDRHKGKGNKAHERCGSPRTRHLPPQGQAGLCLLQAGQGKVALDSTPWEPLPASAGSSTAADTRVLSHQTPNFLHLQTGGWIFKAQPTPTRGVCPLPSLPGM